MKSLSTLAIAAVLLLATYYVARAEEPKAAGVTNAECDRVHKAKSDAGKTISSQDLARDLNLPVETVNECLMRMRQVTPRTPRRTPLPR